MQSLKHYAPLKLLARCRNKQPDAQHEAYCFELFRRAIHDKDSLSWQLLHQQYFRLVYSWIVKSYPPEGSDLEGMTQETLLTFWKYFTSDKLKRARGLADILSYLKSCAKTTVLSAKRQMQRQIEIVEGENLLKNAGENPNLETTLAQELQASEIWDIVKQTCKADKETIVARLSLQYDLPPREITNRHPNLFVDVQEVNRVKRNLFSRLRRHPKLRSMRENS